MLDTAPCIITTADARVSIGGPDTAVKRMEILLGFYNDVYVLPKVQTQQTTNKQTNKRTNEQPNDQKYNCFGGAHGSYANCSIGSNSCCMN